MEFAIILFLIVSISLMVLVKEKEDLFILMLFSIFIINWIAEGLYLIPQSFTWIIELIIFVLFLDSILPKIVYLKKMNLGPFGKYIFLIMIYALIGSFIYLVNFSSILLGFRAIFKYLFLYIIFLNSNFSQNSYKKIFKYWVLLMGIQPLVGGYQYFIEGKISDPVYGTLLSTGFQSILLIVFILFLLDLKSKKILERSLIYITILLSMTIIPIFGEIKAFFYFFPIALLIKNLHLISSLKLTTIAKSFLSLIVVVYLFQSIFLNFWKVELFNFERVNLNDFIFSQGTESITTEEDAQASLAISLSERFLTLSAVYNFLNEDKKRIFFGEGLGSNVFTYDSRNDLTRKQIGGIANQEQYIKKYTLGRVIQNIGVIGLILFSLLIINIGFYSYNASFRVKDNFFRTIYQIIPVFSFFFIIYIFYSDPFTDSISFSYWFFVTGLQFLPELEKN